MDAPTPIAAFTVKRELQTYLRLRLDTFCNPLLYTFVDGHEAGDHDHVEGAGGLRNHG